MNPWIVGWLDWRRGTGYWLLQIALDVFPIPERLELAALLTDWLKTKHD